MLACHEEINTLHPQIPYGVRAGMLYRHSIPVWTTLGRLGQIVGEVCSTADQDALELIAAMEEIDAKYASTS